MATNLNVTDRQLKNLSKLFKLTGRTFQSIATEAGIKVVPNHVTDLNSEDADQIIKSFAGFFRLNFLTKKKTNR
jgi:hypothetical protein